MALITLHRAPSLPCSMAPAFKQAAQNGKLDLPSTSDYIDPDFLAFVKQCQDPKFIAQLFEQHQRCVPVHIGYPDPYSCSLTSRMIQ